MFLKKLNLINTSSYIWSRYEMSVVYAFILVSVKEEQEGISVNVNNSRQCYESAIQSILEQTKEKNKEGGQTFKTFWAELQLNQTLWECRILKKKVYLWHPGKCWTSKQWGHMRLTRVSDKDRQGEMEGGVCPESRREWGNIFCCCCILLINHFSVKTDV